MSTDEVRIDDLAEPNFSPEVREVRSQMAAMARDQSLDAEDLIADARALTGLSDLGDDAFREPMNALLGAVGDHRDISAVGRFMWRAQVVQLLANRLLLFDLLRRNPQIREIEVRAPIVICGLPRTGTTHLHNLMSADPALRHLPYWESLEPFPRPGERGREPDPRLERCRTGLWLINQTMPLFQRMHEMTLWHAHEEIQLLAVDFSTMLFETTTSMPPWRDHYLATDQEPHYRFLHTMLAALQFLRDGERWVLKSPQHLEQFGPLSSVFPDATFVVTHRDPVAVATSMVTMIAYTARMHQDRVEPVEIGRYWTGRLKLMLDSCVRDRNLLPPDRSIDVRFDEFMADDVEMVRRIYEIADQPFTTQVSEHMRRYMADHPRGRHGRIAYEPAALGLDAAELGSLFASYIDRFLVTP